MAAHSLAGAAQRAVVAVQVVAAASLSAQVADRREVAEDASQLEQQQRGDSCMMHSDTIPQRHSTSLGVQVPRARHKSVVRMG